MNKFIVCSVASLVTACGMAPSQVESNVMSQDVSCQAEALVIDATPLNVRKLPNGDVLHALPKHAVVEIVASRGEWLKLAGQSFWQNGRETRYVGPGFVYVADGKRLGVWTGNNAPTSTVQVPLRKNPSLDANDGVTLVENGQAADVIGCQGEFLKVRTNYRGSPKVGWLHVSDMCPRNEVCN